MKDKTVSLVITSCDRFDLLEETLKSFFYFNTYPLTQIIVIEDSGKEKELKNVLNKFKQDFTILINKDKLGQLRSIDKAYSYVESEYIFHCEDDWEFNKYSFIEKSLNILNENSKILSVWIRSIEEFSKIKFSDNIYKSNTNESYKLVYNEILTFNPSLRRISDYKELCSYSQFESKNFEYEISEYYLNKGFVSAILIDPCVNHLGWHRRVANINKNKSKIGYWLDSKIKKMKAKFYKRFSLGKFKNK
ncbi:glycosyltransferase [Arcobacter porcinus]|uniref:Glycosyl transferase family 2 n=1 Tax=Arcobacter porcinus TaxID=1935204 RepID=A0ABX2YAW3_9BACT|nr:glycosyltransferase [Arcobacter porcinus]OCL89933.1 Glycosyl transferase family 2 [Arcobacter porcinus]